METYEWHYIIIGTTKSTSDVADTFTPTQDTKLHTTIGTDNVRNGMCKRKGEMIRDTAIQAANNLPVVLYTAQSRNPHLHTFQLLSLRDSLGVFFGFNLYLSYCKFPTYEKKRRIILGIFVLLNPKLKLARINLWAWLLYFLNDYNLTPCRDSGE